MTNIFLTEHDQIVNLVFVAAIEIDDKFNVLYHLNSGAILSSGHGDRESASAEKWEAFEQMRSGKLVETVS